MTQQDKDISMRFRAAGAVRLVLAILGLTICGHALAQVELTNSVKKVQVTVGETGEVQRALVDADSVVGNVAPPSADRRTWTVPPSELAGTQRMT